MSEQDHEHLADELDREADRLAQENARLGDEIGDVRDDWRRKQHDEGVPGAVVPEGEAPDSADKASDSADEASDSADEDDAT